MKKEYESIINILSELCLIPGLSGYEDEVRLYIQSKLKKINLSYKTDILGNLCTTLKGNSNLPSIMLFAHMDQLGFVIKKIEFTLNFCIFSYTLELTKDLDQQIF